MSTRVRQTQPLGLEMELFLGQPGTGSGYTRAYANWIRYEIIGSSVKPHQKLPDLNARLSRAQRYSYSLLQEWWNGESQDPGLSKAARSTIETFAGLGNVVQTDAQQTINMGNMGFGDTDITDVIHPNIKESTYHRELFHLFLAEFSQYDDIDSKFRSTLNHQRQRCATVAACQRIAYSCLKTVMSPVPSPQHLQASGAADEASHNSSTVEPGPSLQLLGATVEPCPWLDEAETTPQQSRSRLPHFLWDRHARLTVRVADLETRPEYVVISHTWGRWKKDPLVFVDGIPWDVPSNDRFDVASLPDILQTTAFKTPYIWVDLFCIPQSGTDTELMKIASNEIACQAAIFRNASSGAIWIQEIPDWGNLQSTIEWMALKFIIASMPSQSDLSRYSNAAFDSADVSCGLYDSYERGSDPSTAGAEPAGWFTSLWTLQEAFLRPDMWLFDRHWKALAIGEGMPVTLDTLVAMVQEHTNSELSNIESASNRGNRLTLEQHLEDRDLPAGYIELSGLFWTVGMDQLLDSSPLTPLILGNRRYCKSRRAHALMSVIGVTEWFDPDKDKAEQFDDKPEHDLVLGKYPLPFLEEIRKKLGALFFSANLTETEDFNEIRHADGSSLGDIKGIGSALPFSEASQEIRFRNLWGAQEVHDHPSISSWRIQQDGSVLVGHVGIVASTHRLPDTQSISARIMAPLSRNESRGITLHETKDLYQWMKQYCPEQTMVAVHLSCGAGITEAIILEEIGNSSGLFIKTGIVFIQEAEYSIPPSSKVDWRIL